MANKKVQLRQDTAVAVSPDEVISSPAASPLQVTYDEFEARFRERTGYRQGCLADALGAQAIKFSPDGWFMLEAQNFDSTRCGELQILPYGENCTFKKVPETPVSTRGLASDMSVVVAVLLNNL